MVPFPWNLFQSVDGSISECKVVTFKMANNHKLDFICNCILQMNRHLYMSSIKLKKSIILAAYTYFFATVSSTKSNAQILSSIQIGTQCYFLLKTINCCACICKPKYCIISYFQTFNVGKRSKYSSNHHLEEIHSVL